MSESRQDESNHADGESRSATEEDEPDGLYERLKQQDEGWELWAMIGVGLLAAQLLAYGVAFLRLGYVSTVVFSMVIPFLRLLTVPLMFWGLVRALFRPPVWRLSRTYGFGALLVAGLLGSLSFSAPVSTGDWDSEHQYYLPFDGQWVTLAGGDDRDHNYHMTTAAFRWGYDFAPLVDGRRYEGDGEDLEDHHCYGTPVRAPVDGEIVQVLGSEQDHPPGDYDPSNILGNHIVIEVEDDEYLFMAHLKDGSLKVGNGDIVEAGDRVAKCGNSGQTKTPHLHVHLQNRLDFPIAESLPLRFSDYLADGEPVDEGMPLGGENYETSVGEIVENRISWDERLGDEEVDSDDGRDADAGNDQKRARQTASEVETTAREAASDQQ